MLSYFGLILPGGLTLLTWLIDEITDCQYSATKSTTNFKVCKDKQKWLSCKIANLG
jgi:hypothetical protein